MTTNRFKYERNELGGYVVTRKEDNRLLGTLRKAERRYNLQRLIVVRGWSARMPGGPTLGLGEVKIYRTRDEAAEALEAKGG